MTSIAIDGRMYACAGPCRNSNPLHRASITGLVLTVFKLRNDKYSAKVFRYFVEYSDKEAVKKTRTEAEKHQSEEAGQERSIRNWWGSLRVQQKKFINIYVA